jgi:cysteine synthase A
MAPSSENKALVIGLLSGSAITLLATGLFTYLTYTGKKAVEEVQEEEEEQEQPLLQQTEIVEGVYGLIGNTPLMKIKSLSEATGCLVLV